MVTNQDPTRSRPLTWPALRAWLGLTLAAVGAVLLWVGWYRVSGETLVAAQLPYIASASLPGAAAQGANDRCCVIHRQRQSEISGYPRQPTQDASGRKRDQSRAPGSAPFGSRLGGKGQRPRPRGGFP